MIDLFPYLGLQMNKKMQRDFKGTPLITESLKLLRVHHGAEFLLGKPIKVKGKHF